MNREGESRGDERLAELAEEFSSELRKGRLPEVEEYACRHAEFADDIRRIFPSLVVLEEVGKAVGKSEQAFSFLGRPGKRDSRVESPIAVIRRWLSWRRT